MLQMLRFNGRTGSPTTTEDPYYDAERGTREALTDLSIRDTSEEIRARELEVVPTSIHTQQTKDRFSRDFAVPLNPRVG